MSLLMKALKKAEQAKAKSGDSGNAPPEAKTASDDNNKTADVAPPPQARTVEPAQHQPLTLESTDAPEMEVLDFSIGQIEALETASSAVEPAPLPESKPEPELVPESVQSPPVAIAPQPAAAEEKIVAAAVVATPLPPASQELPRAPSPALQPVVVTPEKITVRQQVPITIGKPRIGRGYLLSAVALLLSLGLGYYYALLSGPVHEGVAAVPPLNDQSPVVTDANAVVTIEPTLPTAVDVAVEEATPQSAAAVNQPDPPKAMPVVIARAKRAPVPTVEYVNNDSPSFTQKKISPPVQQAPLAAPLRIEKVTTENPLQSQLQTAYTSYQQGDLDHASRMYRQALQSEADNHDALLGLAVIAQRQGAHEDARNLYSRLLALNPKDSMAASGLLSINEGGVTTHNISQLKLMLQNEPTAAHLHFSLAHEYALQSRWPEAQQAYFQAYRYAPENADYAFNLAVSLEKVGQSKTALAYYHQALNRNANGTASFDRQRVTQRIATLTTTMQEQ